ncbi:MAG: hypothetical protein WDL87_10515 [Candidatus Omnitrophota bacterium]|jgi:cell division protein FtsN
MNETMKNRVVVILAVLVVVSIAMLFKSCNNARQIKLSHDKEVVKRMDLEEKMNKNSQIESGLAQQLKAGEQLLEEEKAAHQATKKALVQEQLVNQSLKEELVKITRLKEALEEDLKEALTSSKIPATAAPKK